MRYTPIRILERANSKACFGEIAPDIADTKSTSHQKPDQEVQWQTVIPITDQGIPINPVRPQEYLILFGVIVASAYFLSRKNGKTPGKSIMGLRVLNVTRRTALSREFFRFAPMVFLVLTNAVPIPDSMRPLDPFGPFFWVISISLIIFFLWYYVWPMVRWTGTLRHDKIAGTQVVRG